MIDWVLRVIGLLEITVLAGVALYVLYITIYERGRARGKNEIAEQAGAYAAELARTAAIEAFNAGFRAHKHALEAGGGEPVLSEDFLNSQREAGRGRTQ